jgi:hypothetical protein
MPLAATPNPSLEPTRYGMRRKPGLEYSVHCRSPGLRRMPPRAAQLQRLARKEGVPLSLLDLLLPEVIIGTLIGLGAAALIHWLAPEPPVLVEAALVAFGALVGVAVKGTKRRGQ